MERSTLTRPQESQQLMMVSPASLASQMKTLNPRAMFKEARAWASVSFIKVQAETHTKMLWVETTQTMSPSTQNNHMLTTDSLYKVVPYNYGTH